MIAPIKPLMTSIRSLGKKAKRLVKPIDTRLKSLILPASPGQRRYSTILPPLNRIFLKPRNNRLYLVIVPAARLKELGAIRLLA